MDGHDEYFVLVFLFVCSYSPEQVYAIVAAVDMYEDFVPWCQSSRVLWCKEDEALDAELKVGFKLFLERYISHVELKRPHLIRVGSVASISCNRNMPSFSIKIHVLLWG